MEPAAAPQLGDAISTSDTGVASCLLCNISITPNTAKAIKQHLKSMTHKKAARGELFEKKQILTRKNHAGGSDEEDADSTVEKESCFFCEALGVEGVFHIAFDQIASKDLTEVSSVCIAPSFLQKPRKSEMQRGDYKTPFFTLQNASMEEYPKDLEHSLQLYCKAPVQRMPNVDVDHQHVEITSLNQVRRVLMDAHSAKVSYWCAYAVDSSVIVNPSWWPPSNPVPGYTQVIIGSGPTDIGIHTDSFGDTKIPVDTYITICAGVKQVLMLPPDANFFEGGKKMEFPLHPSLELLKRIHSVGGYFFKLKTLPGKEMLTLFVPKGWHHWLLGRSKWAVIFGASRF